MPVFAWIMGKLVLVGGFAAYYAPPILGAVLAVYGTVKLGQAVGGAIEGASDVNHGTRVDLASPKDVEELQRKSTEGQVKQHVALAEAAKQVPQIVGGTTELAAKGFGGSGVNRPDRDILEIEPIDTLTEPWTDPAFIPKGPASVSALEWRPLDAKPEVGKQMPLTLIARGVGDAADVSLRVVEGEASLGAAAIHMERGKSAACDIVGSEGVCGVFVTPNRGRRIVLEASSGPVRALLPIEFDTVTAKGPMRMTASATAQATVDAVIQFRTSEMTVKFPVKGGELTAEGKGVLRVDWQLLIPRLQQTPCVVEFTFSVRLRGTASEATLTGAGSSTGSGFTIITGCDTNEWDSSESDPFQFQGTYDEQQGNVTLRIKASRVGAISTSSSLVRWNSLRWSRRSVCQANPRSARGPGGFAPYWWGTGAGPVA
ncbi:MAG: hypothetical protein C0506_09725 [Anaerolinea sp.]|nr:hypothetical protein [Anaerolinea sp.]